MATSQPPLPHALRRVLERELGAASGTGLVARWLGSAAEDAALVDALLETARGSGGEPWELRRIAVLMLEHEVLRGSDPAAAAVCERLGLRPPCSHEGYTAGTPEELARQLRMRLSRNARVHASLGGLETTPRALAAFLRLARRDCRLTLARYLFTAEEVAARIMSQLRVVPAVRDASSDGPPPFASGEAPHTLAELPPFERTILRILGEPARSFWVSEQTPSEINALVEFPLGTVVLTVKPPGSTCELEIKRAGIRGPSALGAACIPHQYTRSHYMRGASTKATLIWEAAAAAFVSHAYRLIHGRDAPLSQAIYLASILNVPTDQGPVNVIRYFTDPAFHGGQFDELRRAIRTAVEEELLREGGQRRAPEHEAALSGAFVGLIDPGQAILTGTSSFRLDAVAKYLAPDGARRYFGRDVPAEESFAFADELFDEILGVYMPPRTRARTYAGYVTAALAANRARANACYRELLAQIGRFWGTLSALRVGSNGESFVPRNVGLRSVWEDGRWQVRILFMDHDGMSVPGLHERDFHPASLARMMMNDYRFIFGGRIPGTDVIGELAWLGAIYRPSDALARKAPGLVRASARVAYGQTLDAFATNGELRRQYGERFAVRHGDWDLAVSTYLSTPRKEHDTWETQTRERLQAAGYGAMGIDGYVKSIRGFDILVRKTAFLYAPR